MWEEDTSISVFRKLESSRITEILIHISERMMGPNYSKEYDIR